MRCHEDLEKLVGTGILCCAIYSKGKSLPPLKIGTQYFITLVRIQISIIDEKSVILSTTQKGLGGRDLLVIDTFRFVTASLKILINFVYITTDDNRIFK